jgi:hypothetical protein
VRSFSADRCNSAGVDIDVHVFIGVQVLTGVQMRLGVRRKIQLFPTYGAQVLLDFAGMCTAPIR